MLPPSPGIQRLTVLNVKFLSSLFHLITGKKPETLACIQWLFSCHWRDISAMEERETISVFPGDFLVHHGYNLRKMQ